MESAKTVQVHQPGTVTEREITRLVQRRPSPDTSDADMIFFCFIERDAFHDVEMKVLEATTAETAVDEARRLEFGGREAHVFDGDRYVATVETAFTPAATADRTGEGSTFADLAASLRSRSPQADF